MTLKEAENDQRFEQFKFCAFIELLQYINRCDIYLEKNPGDKEVEEMREGAKLIRNSRTGVKK